MAMTRVTFERACNLLEEKGFTVIEAYYTFAAFGSWYVTVRTAPRRRIVWDGKDGRLLVQCKTKKTFGGQPIWDDLWEGSEGDSNVLDVAVRRLVQMTRGRGC